MTQASAGGGGGGGARYKPDDGFAGREDEAIGMSAGAAKQTVEYGRPWSAALQQDAWFIPISKRWGIRLLKRCADSAKADRRSGIHCCNSCSPNISANSMVDR